MRFVDVAVNAHIYELLTYELGDYANAVIENHGEEADNTTRTLCRGSRIIVPLRGRFVAGFVVEVHDRQPDFKTVAITAVDQTFSPLDKKYLAFIKWLANFYFYPYGEALFLTLPKRFKAASLKEKRHPAQAAAKKRVAYVLSSANLQPDIRAFTKPQQDCYTLLLRNSCTATSPVSKQLIVDELGTSRAARSLVEKGILETIELEEDSLCRQPSTTDFDKDLAASAVLRTPAKGLTPEQSAALAELQKLSGQNVYDPCVLYGVTGSGKTEIYMQLAEQHLKQGKQVLILIPEINLSFQTIERFEERFSLQVYALHSAMSQRQREENWLAIQAGSAQLIIGTRLAALVPYQNLSLVIVDEEHDSSYDQDSYLRYSARDVAIARAQRLNIQVVLGSATPRLGSFYYSEKRLSSGSSPYRFIELATRATGAQLPVIEPIDTRGESLQGGLSADAIDLIRTNVLAGHQSLVFINRRGFAETMICQLCGYQASCSQCDQKLTIHMQPPSLQCHHCGTRETLVQKCKACHSRKVHALGLGTEQVELVLKKALPELAILRIDSDTMRTSRLLKQTLDRIKSGEPCIIIGTQMLAKGHHFENLNQAIVLNSDQGIFSTSTAVLEETLQTLFQLSGRVGRSDNHPGNVYIQSIDVQNAWYRLLANYKYAPIAKQLATTAKQESRPPFTREITFYAKADTPEQCIASLQALQNTIQSQTSSTYELQISPIIPSRITRVGSHYFYEQSYRGIHKAATHRIVRNGFEQLLGSPLARHIFSTRVA